ncbi:MAG: hypothetical protein N2116_02685 [Armatimonadetes bacterium]|nr:hypothetical protein [Armatimonadota bacterium]
MAYPEYWHTNPNWAATGEAEKYAGRHLQVRFWDLLMVMRSGIVGNR